MKQELPAIWNLDEKTVTITLPPDAWEKAKQLNFDTHWEFCFRAKSQSLKDNEEIVHND